MKTILFDADGVFVDFVKGYLWAVKQATGKDFTPDQITEFDIGKALGLTAEEVKATYAQIKPGFCEALDPLPNAVETIQRLMTIADVYVVTSPLDALPTWAHERKQWIMKHLGASMKGKILSGTPKHLVHGDYFIDDRAENVKSWTEHRVGVPIIWESPWNVNTPWNGLRFNDWAKLEKLITESH